jgi:hypothetical protein
MNAVHDRGVILVRINSYSFRSARFSLILSCWSYNLAGQSREDAPGVGLNAHNYVQQNRTNLLL